MFTGRCTLLPRLHVPCRYMVHVAMEHGTNHTLQVQVECVCVCVRVCPQGQGPKSSPAPARKKVCITRQISSFVNSLLCYIKFGTSIMTLHGHFTKITKKTKHGNVYNDRSTEKNNSQKHGFWTFARSLYKFPCFVSLVVL